MAYNNYFPQYYPQIGYQPSGMPQNAPQMPQNGSANQSNGIPWVQGENAAKAYPVASGQSVLLMDSEGSSFYIKSTDQSGMPLPLRIFDYKERTSEHPASPAVKNEPSKEYVSREEFDAFKSEIQKRMEGEG